MPNYNLPARSERFNGRLYRQMHDDPYLPEWLSGPHAKTCLFAAAYEFGNSLDDASSWLQIAPDYQGDSNK